MNWPRALVIIERFERVTRENLRELRLLLLSIHENSSLSDSRSKRDASEKVDRLLSDLQEVLNVRSHLNVVDRERFDTHIEPIRIQIQAVINAVNKITVTDAPEKNIYDDLYQKSLLEEETEKYEVQKEKQIERNSMLLRVKEAKTEATEMKKLACDIEDLNELMMQLAQLVHTQHDVVDSIEEHVEKAQIDVRKAHKNLKKAQIAKTARYPVIAATVGSIALGGPVGIVAGSAVASIFAAFGGAIAGACGGKYFRQKIQETANQADKN